MSSKTRRQNHGERKRLYPPPLSGYRARSRSGKGGGGKIMKKRRVWWECNGRSV